jgi:hypothetical protein
LQALKNSAENAIPKVYKAIFFILCMILIF